MSDGRSNVLRGTNLQVLRPTSTDKIIDEYDLITFNEEHLPKLSNYAMNTCPDEIIQMDNNQMDKFTNFINSVDG
jgi:hypothetical protein